MSEFSRLFPKPNSEYKTAGYSYYLNLWEKQKESYLAGLKWFFEQWKKTGDVAEPIEQEIEAVEKDK